MLTGDDQRRLRRAGFLPSEIKTLEGQLEQRPQIFNLDDPVWQKVLTERRQYITDERTRGKTDTQIATKLLRRYAIDKQSSPWDFIREAYGRMKPKTSDFTGVQKAAKRARSRLPKSYARAKGRE